MRGEWQFSIIRSNYNLVYLVKIKNDRRWARQDARFFDCSIFGGKNPPIMQWKAVSIVNRRRKNVETMSAGHVAAASTAVTTPMHQKVRQFFFSFFFLVLIFNVAISRAERGDTRKKEDARPSPAAFPTKLSPVHLHS